MKLKMTYGMVEIVMLIVMMPTSRDDVSQVKPGL